MPGKKKEAKSKTTPQSKNQAKSEKSGKSAKTDKADAKVNPKQDAIAAESTDKGSNEFGELFARVDEKYHDYLRSLINHPIRQFQQSTVDDYIDDIAQSGLAQAVARAIDCRDYTRGQTWEKARMDIMNSVLPAPRLLNDVLKEGVSQSCREAIKWYPEASGNPREIIEVLRPVLSHAEAENRWWAAIHLTRHLQEVDELVDVLTEALSKDWIAYKYENSSSGISGRGEAAKALARLGRKAEQAREVLYAQLDNNEIESADAAQIAGALLAITGEVDEIMARLSKIAERVLTERRGVDLHGGDRELLITLKNLIAKWKETSRAQTEEINAKVDLLEKEIKYHLSL